MKRVPSGMPGSSGLHALDAGAKLWAIVTTVPAADYGEEGLASGLQDLEWVGGRAMAHESVVEHFLGAGTVLPMQLFTLFTSDARAVDHVARDRARIDRILDRIDGRLEWGLRLSFDPKAVKPDGISAAPGERITAKGLKGPPASAVSGTSYLARKRDVLQASNVQLAEARKEADRLYEILSREAVESRRRTAIERAVPASRVVLDAAFLVPAKRGGAFTKAVRQHTRPFAGSAVDVALTGPWPAYNFIDVAENSDAAAKKRRTPRSATKAPPVSGAASAPAAAKRPARGRI